ncbi:predicted protein, partial [Arabidopsis lyrata subsp. lyrata]
MARRIQRRSRCRDLYQQFVTPVVLGFLLFLVYSTFMIGYRIHKRSSLKDNFGNNFIDKDLNWREREALESVPSLFTKERLKQVLDALSATTSSDNPLSLDSLRKNHSMDNSVQTSSE